MAFGDFKDIAERTVSNKIVRDKAFNIAKNPKYDVYQRGLASILYKFFDKKSSESGTAANNVIKQNIELADELHKLIIEKLKKRKIYSSFKDNIWVADLADMQLISKFNKGFRFLLCVIDIFSKYAWVVPLKYKKGISVVNASQEILKESDRNEAKSKGRRSNKIWVDKGSEFYNNSFKTWLKSLDIKMYSMHNEGKSVAAEIFVRTNTIEQLRSSLLMLKIIHILILRKKLMIKIQNLKLVIA